MNVQISSATQAWHVVPRVAEAGSSFNRSYRGLLAGLGVAAAFLVSVPALAATAPSLGSESTYGIVSETYTNTVAGTTINGTGAQPAVCYTTGPAVVPTITGTTVTPCPPATGTDQGIALADLNSQSCTSIGAAVALNTISIGGGTPGTFPPGCYSSTGAMSIATGTTVTLSGAGVYIFRPGGAFDPAANSNVVAAGGACANDVFWAPVGGTTIGANSNFVGNVFRGVAAGLSITLGSTVNFQGRALAFGSTVTTDTDTITVPTCAAYVAPGLPTITVTKVSTGGVGPFSFTGSNGFAPQTITTVTSGVGVSGATQTLTAAGASTAITESAPPVGYTLASINCTGLGAGGTQTPVIGTRTVTLDAAATAAGSAIVCTFTNTFSAAPVLPTITVTKVSNGGVGPFSFTGSNGFAPQTITTVTSGVGVSGATQTLTAAGASTAITESAPPVGYTLASINCTGLGAGGTQTPVIGTRTVTLDAAATAAGAAIACTFTNTFSSIPVPPTPSAAASIPTLSEWAMMLLIFLMAIVGFTAMRKQAR